MPQGEVIATFGEYNDALRYVETLIENDFPAGAIAIVGNGLRSVERIRTRINQWRVALSGAISGSWVGLIFGLVFVDATSSTGPVPALTQPILVGAGLGMIANVLRFTLTRNKRNFASQSMVIAAEYQVQVPSHLSDQARTAAAKKL